MKQVTHFTNALKLAMYVSELCLLNILFYLFFEDRLSPDGSDVTDMSALYNWLATLLAFCYIIGVWLRPISFFYRSSRAGNVVQNVMISTSYMLFFFLVAVIILGRRTVFDPWLLLAFYFTVCVVFIVWRVCAKTMIRYVRSLGHNIHHVIFVGSKESLAELYEEMSNPFYGYKVIGYFADAPVTAFPDAMHYLGSVAQAIPFMQRYRVQQLYCGLPSSQADLIRPLINYCEHNCVRFFSVPDIRVYLRRTMQMESLGAVPVLYIREDPLMLVENQIIKRTFDIVVAGLFMIPFWVVIYPVVGLITKLTSPGPIFFKQRRNGLNGEEFECYKFRSMRVNAEADRVQATSDDPRKTRFGNFLRRSSIDELPQFINVLRGEMSIVGPRPHMIRHTEEYSALIDKYMVRHWVKPGITGWAQVTGARGETRELRQMEERIRKDVWYIENWSFWLDIKIILMTVINAFRGDKQAY